MRFSVLEVLGGRGGARWKGGARWRGGGWCSVEGCGARWRGCGARLRGVVLGGEGGGETQVSLTRVDQHVPRTY